jgi:hypothetical protein
MDEHLIEAIALLQTVADNLQQLVDTPMDERTPRAIIDAAKADLRRITAEISAAVAPPLHQVPDELLSRAAKLGVPLDDLEVRVAISSHHPSQLLAILNEIENRFEQIKRVREYLILRLPDMPIESMGSRLPVYTAADFTWHEPRLSEAELAAIKAKHQLNNRSFPDRRQPTLSEQIAAAQAAWEQAKSHSNPDLPEDWTKLPF